MMPGEERFNHIEDLFDRMDHDGRSRHVESHLLDVQTPEGLTQARELVNEAIACGFVTAAELARRTNLRPSAISAFRNRKWKGATGTQVAMASALAKAIDQLKRQRVAEETSIDGFVSINAPYSGGTVVTQPFTFKGDRLILNMSTAMAGTIQVGIQDAKGKYLPGYHFTGNPAMWGDEIERAVGWPLGGGDSLRFLEGKPIRLVFRLKDADVFSFRFGETPATPPKAG